MQTYWMPVHVFSLLVIIWVNIAAHCLTCFTFSLNLYTSNPWRSDNPNICIPANPEPENGCKAYCVIRTVRWLVLFIMTVEDVGASACRKKKKKESSGKQFSQWHYRRGCCMSSFLKDKLWLHHYLLNMLAAVCKCLDMGELRVKLRSLLLGNMNIFLYLYPHTVHTLQHIFQSIKLHDYGQYLGIMNLWHAMPWRLQSKVLMFHFVIMYIVQSHAKWFCVIKILCVSETGFLFAAVKPQTWLYNME